MTTRRGFLGALLALPVLVKGLPKVGGVRLIRRDQIISFGNNSVGGLSEDGNMPVIPRGVKSIPEILKTTYDPGRFWKPHESAMERFLGGIDHEGETWARRSSTVRTAAPRSRSKKASKAKRSNSSRKRSASSRA